MGTFQGAVIREQGVEFAIVIVKKSVIDNRTEAQRVCEAYSPLFPGLPILLMAQDHRGVPTYFGRQDIARFMAKVPLQAVPWRQYTLN